MSGRNLDYHHHSKVHSVDICKATIWFLNISLICHIINDGMQTKIIEKDKRQTFRACWPWEMVRLRKLPQTNHHQSQQEAKTCIFWQFKQIEKSLQGRRPSDRQQLPTSTKEQNHYLNKRISLSKQYIASCAFTCSHIEKKRWERAPSGESVPRATREQANKPGKKERKERGADNNRLCEGWVVLQP